MRLAAIVVVFWSVTCSSSVTAQLIKAPLTDGFARTSSIEMSVDEMLGTSKVRGGDQPILGPGYPALWIAEIQYKPMRLMRLPVTDPRTGKKSVELIWYLVYRTIPRDYTELAGDGQEALIRKLSDPDHDPANQVDPLRAAPLQMPRFTLRLEDAGAGQQEFVDEINLEIQKAVFQREMGKRSAHLKLHNSIEAIADVSEPVSMNASDPLAKATYGVAIWRNVDPKTDYFTVFMSGLTNAYRISGEGDARKVEEKVVVQKFARPGDEFLQEESEFRLIDQVKAESGEPTGQSYPYWTYRPRNASLEVPEVDSVLRNARRNPAPVQE